MLHITYVNQPDYSPEKTFNPELLKEMDNYYEAILGGKKVLGVLARGTDYGLVYKEGVQDRYSITDERLFDKLMNL